MFLGSKSDKKYTKKQEGFTLTELLVVMGIIFFLATISLSNYNKFGRTIDLENTAYAVALAVRESQVYGINRLSDSLTGVGSVDLDLDTSVGEPIPYGVYFNISQGSPVSGTGRTGFINFVDVVNSDPVTQDRLFNDDGLTGNCSANSSSECLSTASFAGNTYIYDLCTGPDSEDCASVETLHITFKRPDPDAEINVSPADVSNSYARITLGSTVDDELFKSVAIGAAGQITIE